MRNDIEIRKLFGDYRYRLDNILQRPYEWEKERVVKFINDICNSKLICDNGGSIRYNVGDFITYNNGDDVYTKYLFDGQQRMTTLMLLLANIKHHGPSDNCKETINVLLYATEWHGSTAQRVKRLTLREDDDDILSRILETGLNNLSKKECKSCLAKNYKLISSEFTDGKNSDELDKLYETIITNASYFERECESREEGIRQFNNLNGWQQPLKRSRLGISSLYSIYRDSNQNYKEADKFLCVLSNMKDKDAQEFLALFIYYRCKGRYIEQKFPLAFEKLVKEKVDVIDEAVRFYNTTYHDITNGINEIFNSPFLKLSPLRQVYVDLFTDKYAWTNEISQKDKCEIYKKFEWAYISNLVMKQGQMGGDKFSGIISSYNAKEHGCPIQYVKQELINRDVFMTANNLKEYRNTRNEIFTNILLRVEYQYGLELDIKEPVQHKDTVTIEHIHPQKPRKGAEYHCDDNLTNTIGNYTLMGKSGNGSNSNKPFDEKRDLYKISPYLINSNHLYDYQEWNNDTIQNNAEWYIERIRRFYGID